MRSTFSVTTPVDNASLLTVEELRAAGGVAGNGQDAALMAMGLGLSEAIARDCGVCWDGVTPPTFKAEACLQAFYPARRTSQLRLARRPIVAVSTLTMDGETVSGSDFLFDKASGVVWPKYGTWQGEVIVGFTAGFEDVPESLKLAATKLMTALWAEKGRDPSLKRETVEGVGSLEFWIPPSSDPLISAEIADLLSPFRERWF